jgi:hypothetical protein
MMGGWRREHSGWQPLNRKTVEAFSPLVTDFNPPARHQNNFPTISPT